MLVLIQSPVKTFLPPPAADQMPVRPPGPTPLMAATNHIPPGKFHLGHKDVKSVFRSAGFCYS